jgi:uncharacterized membrane protein YgcG
LLAVGRTPADEEDIPAMQDRNTTVVDRDSGTSNGLGIAIVAIIAIAAIVAVLLWQPWNANRSNTTVVNPPGNTTITQPNTGTGTTGGTTGGGSGTYGGGTSGGSSGSGTSR